MTVPPARDGEAPAIHFREAEAADLEALVALLADDALGESREMVTSPPLPQYREAFARVCANPNETIIVATIGGEIAGCAQLTILDGLSRQGARRAQIEAVRVSAAHRGRGLGEALITHLLERARNAGCTMAQLTSDRTRERAHAFYERLGFKATHVGMKLPL